MLIRLDVADERPLYQQIVDEVRRGLVLGTLSPEDPLPSVRALAAELRVNPNTVQQAYRELERAGIIYSRRGQGTFVASPGGGERELLLPDVAERALKDARRYGIEPDELAEAILRAAELHPSTPSTGAAHELPALPTRLDGAELAIETRSLVKRFDGTDALRGLDLQVPAGAVYVLAGPNGSGKSTAIKILLDVVRADHGTARVLGIDTTTDPALARAQIGYVPEKSETGYEWIRVERFLRHHAAFFETWDPGYAALLCRRLRVPLRAELRNLSKGALRSVILVTALAHRPPVLLLDEPTDGLDPLVREELMALLADHMADSPTTLLWSTHHVDEVERMADHVGGAPGWTAGAAGPARRGAPAAAPLPRGGAGGVDGRAGAERPGAAARGGGARDRADRVGRGARGGGAAVGRGRHGARRRAALAGRGHGGAAARREGRVSAPTLHPTARMRPVLIERLKRQSGEHLWAALLLAGMTVYLRVNAVRGYLLGRGRRRPAGRLHPGVAAARAAAGLGCRPARGPGSVRTGSPAMRRRGRGLPAGLSWWGCTPRCLEIRDTPGGTRWPSLPGGSPPISWCRPCSSPPEFPSGSWSSWCCADLSLPSSPHPWSSRRSLDGWG